MSHLTRHSDFFQDLVDVRRKFDRMFDGALIGWPADKALDAAKMTKGPFVPAVESYIDKDGKKYFCRLPLPGIEPKDVQIQAQGRTLTITGERKVTRKTKSVDFYDEEIIYGSFARTLTLPEGVQGDRLSAEFQHGVLEITAPVAAAALPKKIEVRIGLKKINGPKGIAA